MHDMTNGDPRKQLLLFMLPVLLGNIFQQFYNIVDILIVGNFLGVDALAAVGMTASISTLVVGWITGITSGFGILIAQAVGASDNRRLRHCTAMSVYLSVACAIGMTVGLLLVNDVILELMNTPENIFADTKAYIGVIYAGLSATVLYNLLAAIARALGDSKTPLYFLMLSSVLNIGLDYLFVGVIPFGVVGAGYATVISQAIAAIMCLIFVYKKYPELRFNRAEATINWITITRLLAVGIPMGLQFSITAIGSMILQSSVNLLGSIYIASYAACCKIQAMLVQVAVALGSAIANFVGQNYGAGKMDRVRRGVRISLEWSSAFNLITMILAYEFCPSLVVYFAEDTTSELVEVAREFFRISLWCYIPLGAIFIYRNALQGLGRGLIPMMGGVFELIARAITVVVLFESLQFVSVCLAGPIAWISALIPLIPYYYWLLNKIDPRIKEPKTKSMLT